jgi:AcrR family transcriptional regulator
MGRARAAGFDERRKAITASAALQFVRSGFLGASVADISATSGVPKSVIYHYFSSKEDILFAVMWEHASNLVHLSKTIASRDWLADEALRWLARVLLEAYNSSPWRHKIMLKEIDNLRPEKRAVIVQAQQDVFDVADKYVARLSHSLRDAPKQRVPYVMMYFGMLNWTHTWFDRTSPFTEKKVADIATDMFLKGLPR